MNVPPPFTPPTGAPPRKNNTGLIVAIVLICILVPCAGLIAVSVLGVNWFKNTIGPLASCAIGFEQVRDSLIEYADKHDGKLPRAETWQDDVRPIYAERVKNPSKEYGPFKPMEPDGDWGCKVDQSMTGIAFNSDLSGKVLKDIKDPRTTILIFEIEKALKNAHEPFKSRSKATSPRIMGEHRGWIEIPIEGDAEGFDTNGNTKFEFKSSKDSVEFKTSKSSSGN